jgi:hypothetical protein
MFNIVRRGNFYSSLLEHYSATVLAFFIRVYEQNALRHSRRDWGADLQFAHWIGLGAVTNGISGHNVDFPLGISGIVSSSLETIISLGEQKNAGDDANANSCTSISGNGHKFVDCRMKDTGGANIGRAIEQTF